MEANLSQDADDFNRIQAFLINNPELEKLESMLDRFNIFDALSIKNQEVRHSDFLAYLLNPNQNHGLNDLFIKRFLQESLTLAGTDLPITPIKLELWDLDEIDVFREWHDIDILLLDASHEFAVIIENKVLSGEHSDQLKRYTQIVTQHYPGYSMIKLFLTPEGDQASDPSYISISYTLICEVLENITNTRENSLGQEILVLLKHYVEMLRRYIVGDSEIEKLCQQIYRKHHRALDLIYENIPDQQAEIKDFLIGLIISDQRFELDHTSKSYIYFSSKKWDNEKIKSGKGWTRSGRMLLFQFANFKDLLRLTLVIGPGPEEIRQKLFEFIRQQGSPYKRSLSALGKMWLTVYTRDFIKTSSDQEKSTEELKEEIKRKWGEFLEHEFSKIEDPLADEIRRLG